MKQTSSPHLGGEAGHEELLEVHGSAGVLVEDVEERVGVVPPRPGVPLQGVAHKLAPAHLTRRELV